MHRIRVAFGQPGEVIGGGVLSSRIGGALRSFSAAVARFLVYRKHRSRFDFNTLRHAASPGFVGEPDVITSGGDAGDTQPLVEIHTAVGIGLALIGAPPRRAC
jgi:hypothetical protein